MIKTMPRKRKPNLCVAWGYTPLRPCVALLGTQLMEYGPTHHIIIWLSFSLVFCGDYTSRINPIHTCMGYLDSFTTT